jgi:putative oxidoreductase
MSQLFLVGRIVLGAYFLYNAANHFLRLEPMSAYVAAHNVPFPTVAVVLAGLLLLVAGLSFLLGVVPKLGVAAAVLFLVPVTLVVHQFWAVGDAQARMAETVNFTKNFALAGAALMFLAVPEPWPYSLHVPVQREARAAT